MSTSSLRGTAVRRIAGPFLASALVASALAGCGGGSGEDRPAVEETPATDLGTPTVTATPTPTVPLTPQPKPTRKPTQTEGDGDADEVDEPAAAGGGVCTELGEEEVGAALGGVVTGAALPGGGCAFTQRKPQPPAANVIDVPYADMAGGMDGAKENATSTVEGTPQDLAGIGEAAFVVTGTSFGGDQVQGAGAVRVGDRLVSVNLAQSAGLKPAKVRALVVRLLRLAVDELD